MPEDHTQQDKAEILFVTLVLSSLTGQTVRVEVQFLACLELVDLGGIQQLRGQNFAIF